MAVRRVQYRAVPSGRGPQRAAVHAIMTQGAVRKQQPDALTAQVTVVLTHAYWHSRWCRRGGGRGGGGSV